MERDNVEMVRVLMELPRTSSLTSSSACEVSFELLQPASAPLAVVNGPGFQAAESSDHDGRGTWVNHDADDKEERKPDVRQSRRIPSAGADEACRSVLRSSRGASSAPASGSAVPAADCDVAVSGVLHKTRSGGGGKHCGTGRNYSMLEAIRAIGPRRFSRFTNSFSSVGDEDSTGQAAETTERSVSDWATLAFHGSFLAVRAELIDFGNLLDSLRVRCCRVPREVEYMLLIWFRPLHEFVNDVFDIETSTLFPLIDAQNCTMEERMLLLNTRKTVGILRRNIGEVLTKLLEALERIQSRRLIDLIGEIRSLVKNFAERILVYCQEILQFYPSLLDRSVPSPKAQRTVDSLVVRKLLDKSSAPAGKFAITIYSKGFSEEGLKLWKKQMEPRARFSLFRNNVAHSKQRGILYDRLMTIYH
mmetsp:Transcript_11878/g.24203  ORF Transcript_11878/g.24203 Transcript_11878/m.24203 type:complete len:419 (+) Transcript_11878:35-1291(+)